VVIEEAFVDPRYPKVALRLGEVRGTVSVAAHNMKVEVFEINPSEVKRALTGRGLAAKEEVKMAVSRALRLSDQTTPHHVSDALGLALTGLSRKGLLCHL
jgi:crossover junction endodeoxyribonuclease RuvC